MILRYFISFYMSQKMTLAVTYCMQIHVTCEAELRPPRYKGIRSNKMSFCTRTLQHIHMSSQHSLALLIQSDEFRQLITAPNN